MPDPYTWPQAPLVSVGEKFTSAQFNKLAAAFNERLKSGLGDLTWRMWFKAYVSVGVGGGGSPDPRWS